MRRTSDLTPSYEDLEEREEPSGPRGGTTTRTPSGMMKKNFWLSIELAEELRQRAYEERRTESAIIREGLIAALRQRSDSSRGGSS
jgi:hypothetical protein